MNKIVRNHGHKVGLSVAPTPLHVKWPLKSKSYPLPNLKANKKRIAASDLFFSGPLHRHCAISTHLLHCSIITSKNSCLWEYLPHILHVWSCTSITRRINEKLLSVSVVLCIFGNML